MYKKGKGITQNKSKAKQLFARACNMGSSGACSKYRRLRDEGVQ